MGESKNAGRTTTKELRWKLISHIGGYQVQEITCPVTIGALSSEHKSWVAMHNETRLPDADGRREWETAAEAQAVCQQHADDEHEAAAELAAGG